MLTLASGVVWEASIGHHIGVPGWISRIPGGSRVHLTRLERKWTADWLSRNWDYDLLPSAFDLDFSTEQGKIVIHLVWSLTHFGRCPRF